MESQFFHNVDVFVIGMTSDLWQEDFDAIWYLDQITAFQPRAVLFYQEEENFIEYYGGCTVEVEPDGTISWYEYEEESYD